MTIRNSLVHFFTYEAQMKTCADQLKDAFLIHKICHVIKASQPNVSESKSDIEPCQSIKKITEQLKYRQFVHAEQLINDTIKKDSLSQQEKQLRHNWENYKIFSIVKIIENKIKAEHCRLRDPLNNLDEKDLDLRILSNLGGVSAISYSADHNTSAEQTDSTLPFVILDDEE